MCLFIILLGEFYRVSVINDIDFLKREILYIIFCTLIMWSILILLFNKVNVSEMWMLHCMVRLDNMIRTDNKDGENLARWFGHVERRRVVDSL